MHADADVLRCFRQSDFPIYQSWFCDPETRQRVSFPDECWLAHLLGSSRSTCWVLDDANVPGGVSPGRLGMTIGMPSLVSSSIRPNVDTAWQRGSCARFSPTIAGTSRQSHPASIPTTERT
jgi:hypothetical protein